MDVENAIVHGLRDAQRGENLSRVTAIHPLLSGSYQMELRNGARLTTGRQYKDVVQELIRG